MPNDAPNQPKLDATSVLQHCSVMPQWTPDQARSYKEIASKARTAAAQTRKIREKLLDKLVIDAAQRADLPKQDSSTQPNNPYATVQIARCEEQIASLWTKLADAESAADSDRYASAIARLSEVRRVLAREPLPGSERPQAPRRAVAVFTPPADS